MRRHRAETLGETYPQARVEVHTNGVFIWCNVSIAWSGADPAVAKNRIDDAVRIVRDVYNKTFPPELRGELDISGVEINSTPYQGVVQLNMATRWENGPVTDPEELYEWEWLIKDLGVKVESPLEE